MQIEEIFVSAVVTIFSFGLLCIALLSYKKFKNVKLLFVGLVFLVFLVKSIIISLSIFYSSKVLLSSFVYIGLFDLLVLMLLFIATLKR